MEKTRKNAYIRMTISVCVALMALLVALTKRTPYALLVLPGMLFGTHGDFCLAELPFIKKMHRDPFLVGMASFLIGHILYSIAYVNAMQGGMRMAPFVVMFLALALLAVALWALCMRKSSEPTVMRVAVLIYALVIVMAAAFAFALGKARGGAMWLPFLGGLLFIVSDALILINRFGGVRLPNATLMIWGTYVPAQLLIVLAGCFA